MHSDVGGGYPESGLSDIPLVWMIKKATEHGLRIYDKDRISIERNPDGVMHDSRGTWWKRLYRKKRRNWPKGRPTEPVVHQCVLDRTVNIHNNGHTNYAPWILDLNFEVEPWSKWLV
jgi:hypothetical protein